MTATTETAARPPRASSPASSSNCSTSSSASSGAPPPAKPRSWAGPTYSRRYSTRAALRGLALDRAQRHDTTGCTGLSRSLKPWFVQTQTPARGSRPRSYAPLSALAASLRSRGDAHSWWEGHCRSGGDLCRCAAPRFFCVRRSCCWWVDWDECLDVFWRLPFAPFG